VERDVSTVVPVLLGDVTEMLAKDRGVDPLGYLASRALGLGVVRGLAPPDQLSSAG
jgi:hypothetical protein